ncbi:MAG: MlaE family ABC transporter permease [Thiobacillaceae bacterium]
MGAPALTFRQFATGWVIQLHGDWVLANLPLVTRPALPQMTGPIRLDGSGLGSLDTSGAHTLLNLISDAGSSGQELALDAFLPTHRQILELVSRNEAAVSLADLGKGVHRHVLTRLGYGASQVWDHVIGLTRFLGQLVSEWLGLIRRPKQFRFKELTIQIESVFMDAIPIIMAMLFLLGVIFAYLLGIQAEKYGANIFVVDGVAAAILREISPVITAILVAGRSGAAITAQLGTMKVNEEIDAISVLGLSPFAVLVIPRIVALVVALPLLVFLGDVAGLLGGMVVADSQLGIDPHLFFDRLGRVLRLETYLIGLAKAPVFGLFVGLIACRMGLSVARDARSVGVHTTSTVVQSIVAVIVLNAIFAILFAQVPV